MAARAPRKPTTPQKTGRPTKYTPETVQLILTALAIGNTKEDSALGAGISYQTMRTWELTYPEFLEATEKAQAQARQRFVGIIARAASEGNWQAAAWNLERRDPDQWGRRERVDVMHDISAVLRGLTSADAEYEAAKAEADRIVRAAR